MDSSRSTGQSISEARKRALTSVVSAMLPILFFLKQYGYGFTDLYLTGAIALSVFCFLVHPALPTLDKARTAFLLFAVFYSFRIALTLVFGVSRFDREYIVTILRCLVSSGVIVMLADYIDEEKMRRVWKWLGVIVGIAVLFQSIQIYFWGQRVYPILLMPPTISTVMSNVWFQAKTRPVAFFTEPSVIAAFLLPLLFLTLRKQQMKYSVFATLIILLSGTTSGLVGAAFLWMMAILSQNSNTNARISTVLFFTIIIAFVLLSPLFNTTIDKLMFELSGDSNNVKSRITGGWLFFDALDWPAKIIGINDVNMSRYIRSHYDLLIHASQTRTAAGYNYYVNTAQRILLTSGIVGGIVYTWMLKRIYSNLDPTARAFFWLTVIEMFYSWNLFTSNYYMIQMFVLFIFLKHEDRASEPTIPR